MDSQGSQGSQGSQAAGRTIQDRKPYGHDRLCPASDKRWQADESKRWHIRARARTNGRNADGLCLAPTLDPPADAGGAGKAVSMGQALGLCLAYPHPISD